MPRCRQPLLVLLLPLSFDVELPLLAPELRRPLPVKLVPVDRQGVVDGDRVTHELSLGGERQLPVREFRFLNLRRALPCRIEHTSPLRLPSWSLLGLCIPARYPRRSATSLF